MGPIAQIAMALPLRSWGIKSAMIPPPTARGVEPAQPAAKRKKTNMPRSCETAQHMVKMMKNKMVHLTVTDRPYTSASGARNRVGQPAPDLLEFSRRLWMQRTKDKGTESESQHKNRDDERSKLFVGGVEVAHDLRHSGRKH